jgi:hypothetical protein
MTTQHELGQFYSSKAAEILDGMIKPPSGTVVVEPFAGEGDLLKWLGPGYIELAYDIDPKTPKTIRRDSLMNPPCFAGSYVVSNPPWLAKNKTANKTPFEKWGTDDLYKCFIQSLLKDPPIGGIIIVPLNFFSGHRQSEKTRRCKFLTSFKPLRINVFEQSMFTDTDYLTIAIQFQRRVILDAQISEEQLTLNFYPSRETLTFRMNPYLPVMPNEDPLAMLPAPPVTKFIRVRRHEEDRPLKPSETLTQIFFEALDSGTTTTPGVGRIGLRWLEPEEIYIGKATSRSKAQIVVRGHLSHRLQKQLIQEFNQWLEDWRQKTRSVFLPVFREAKDHPRRRMTFEIAFEALRNLIWQHHIAPAARPSQS